MNRRQRMILVGTVVALTVVFLLPWLAGQEGELPPPPAPTPTPTPTPTASVTIKTVDQSGGLLDADIYVDGQRVGSRSVVFEAEIGKFYKVTFGNLAGYITPSDVPFTLDPDGKLPDGSTTIEGIYEKEVGGEGQVKLTVEVRQGTGIPGYSTPLRDVSVEVVELELKGKTDSDGLVSFWVPKGYGAVTVKATTTGGEAMSRLVTIGVTNVKVTMTFPAPTLTVGGILGGGLGFLWIFIVAAIAWYLWKRRRRVL